MTRTLLLLLAGFFGLVRTLHAAPHPTTTVTADSLIAQVDSLWLTSCAGTSDGAIFISVTGGTAPFSFEWSNGATTDDLVGLSAGFYTCRITDADGNQADLIDIEVQSPLEVLLEVTVAEGPTCLAGGQIVVTPLGGTPDFTFNWSNGATSGALSDLAAGDYSVTATDANGCTAETSVSLAEPEHPIASAGPDLELLCSKELAELGGTAVAANDVSFAWTATDGGIILGGQNSPTLLISHTGVYTLLVTDVVNGCTASDEAIVTAKSITPNASVAGGTLTCNVDSVQLTAIYDDLNTLVVWRNTAGDTLTGDELIVTAPGTFRFSITDTLTGCGQILFAVVTQSTTPPAVTLSANGAITCAQTSVEITASTALNGLDFQWVGPNGYTSGEQNPVVNEPGDYTLNATNSDNGCTSENTISIEEDRVIPTAEIATPEVLTCANPTVTLDGSASSQGAEYEYRWSLNGSAMPGGLGSTIEVSEAGNYMLMVFNTENGCMNSDFAIVTSDTDAPTATATGGDVLTCANPVTQILGTSDTPGTTWEWVGPSGFTSVELNPTVSIAGDYIFYVTQISNGCTAAATVTVSENKTPPDVTATGDTLTCLKTSATLVGSSQTPGTTFTWWAGAAEIGDQPTQEVFIAGIYGLIATDPANGCSAQTVYATVVDDNQAPVADAGDGGTLNCNVVAFTLNGSGSAQGPDISYLWTTADGNIQSGETALDPVVDAAGTYTLLVSDAGNGCTAVDEVTIEQTQPIVVSVLNLTNVSCYGGTGGWLAAQLSGGTGDFSFAWSSGSNDADAKNLPAGTYGLTVTDADGCFVRTTATVAQPSPIAPNLTATGVTAAGANDGAVASIVSGGTAPYFYQWSDGRISESIDLLSEGVYTLTVSDANGCTAEQTTTVNAAGCAISASIEATDPACGGEASGAARLTVLGATDPIEIVWSNGATGAVADGLAAGNHIATITDAAGCVFVVSTQINGIQPLTSGIQAQANVLCPADATGSLRAFALGGTQPYNFEWSNDSQDATNNLLGVGDYTLTVSDANGCTSQVSATISATDNVPPVLSLNDIAANLGPDGTVSVSASDFDKGSFDAECGIATWAVEPSEFDCDDLGEHVVTLTATDANGNAATATATVFILDRIAPTLNCPANITVGVCNATANFDLPAASDNCAAADVQIAQTGGPVSGSDFPLGESVLAFEGTDVSGNIGSCAFSITVEALPELQATSSNTSCNGICDGGVGVLVLNGNPNVEVDWSNNASGEEISDLCAGDYTATVTDVNGCTQTVTASVLDLPVLVAAAEISQSPTCPDEATGAATATATGGNAPYSFLWSNGSPALENVEAGDYSVTATDANGCTSTATVSIQNTDNEAPVAVLQNLSVALNSLGLATINPADFDAGSTDNCGIVGFSVSQEQFDCDNIGSNQVTVTVTDAAGNETSQTVTVTVVDDIAPVLNCPANIAASYCHADVNYLRPTVQDNCATIPGNLQQTEGLASGATFPTGLTTNTFTYTDGAGNAASCSFTVRVAPPMTVSGAVTNVSCAGECDGSIAIIATGGIAPYTYTWSGGGLDNLCPGSYTITITDAEGCSELATFTITEPTAIATTVDQVTNDQNSAGVGAINISVAGGTGAYTYSWSKDGGAPFATTQDLTGLTAGFYTCVITDANGCRSTVGPIEVKNIVGTAEPAWASNLKMQPNPASDFVQIALTEPLGQPAQIILTDAAGRTVRVGEISPLATTHQLDVSALPAGVWQVQIRTADGGRAARKLLVVRD